MSQIMSHTIKLSLNKIAKMPIAVSYKAYPYIWRTRPNSPGVQEQDPSCGPVGLVVSHAEFKLDRKNASSVRQYLQQHKYMDGRQLRDRFMRLKTDEDFLNFLNDSGVFIRTTKLFGSHKHRGWQFADFRAFQKLFAALAKRAPATWEEYSITTLMPELFPTWEPIEISWLVNDPVGYSIRFQWKGEEPRDWYGAKQMAVIETFDVVSTIMVTIELDHLRGAKFGVCARHDCPQFFEITSRHKRKYCSSGCAHLVAVRRVRKRQQNTSQAQARIGRAERVSATHPTGPPRRGPS